MRILADLPDEDIAALDDLARRNNRSRAAELREAVHAHLRGRASNDWIGRGAGYWQGRDDLDDGVAYQRVVRQDRTLG